MKMRRGWLAMVVVLALGATLITGCAKDDTNATDDAAAEPYRIGAVLSLTGTYAGLGMPEKNAIELEVARVNDAGGIDGHPVEVIYEDDATDPAKAVAAAARLIDQENVLAIIGATGTGQTMAIRSEIARAGVPQVSMAGGSVVTDDFDPLVFQTPWPNRIVVPFNSGAQGARSREGRAHERHGRIRRRRARHYREGRCCGGRAGGRGPDVQPRRHRHDPAAHQDQGASPDVVLMWNAGKRPQSWPEHAAARHEDAACRQSWQRAQGVHRWCRGCG